MPPERVVSFRLRSVLQTTAVLLAVGAGVLVVWVARHALTWILIALFLALALNPVVEALQRRGVRRRGAATGLVLLAVIAVVAGIAAIFVPVVVRQVSGFVDAVPGYVDDLTRGRGPLGFLQTEYQVVDRVREALRQGGGTGASGLFGGAVSVTRGIATGIAGLVTIIFLTLFMLLEGPAWTERVYGLLRPEHRDRWRDVGDGIYRTIGGYVSGNLLISFIAGTATTLVLLALGVPYAVALGLVVALLDLIPLAGATLAAVIVTLVALTDSTTSAIIVAAFFIVYQQLENHLLQPLVYGRTVQLSPLAVLIAVLIGIEVAGILGALAAIPIAGSLQVLLRDWQEHRGPADGGPPAEDRFERAPQAPAPVSGSAAPR
jgi:predicted PurR-regulated permease PerM